jgi:hypothetical protein
MQPEVLPFSLLATDGSGAATRQAMSLVMYHCSRIKTDVETAGPSLTGPGDVLVAYCRQIGGLHRPPSCSTMLHPMGTPARQASGNNPVIAHNLLSTCSRAGVRPWTEQTRRQRPATAGLHTTASSKAPTKATENHG